MAVTGSYGLDGLRRARGAAQLLGPERLASAGAVVERLVAVQAQSLRAAKLAIRARSDGLTEADVDAALGESLVAGWLMRGTLHLVTREDYGWLHPIFAPRLVPRTLSRLHRLGIGDPDPLVDAVAASLPATRAEIAELTGLSGQAVPHLIALTAHRGRLLVAGEHVYAPASVEGRPAVHHERDLARRYLRAHAPATPEDFAAWAGLPLRTARAAIQTETQVPGTPVSSENRVTGTSASLPARLLGPFDPWLLGWRDRGFAVPEGMRRHVHPGGGMLRAVATVDGVVTATWTMPGGEPVLVPPDERFATEAADVRRFFAASG